MYSMKEACELTDMTYENLKFYCNEGLVPNIKRDKRNYRVFDDHDIKQIKSLNYLKNRNRLLHLLTRSRTSMMKSCLAKQNITVIWCRN